MHTNGEYSVCMLGQTSKLEESQPAETHVRAPPKMSLLRMMDLSLWRRTLVSLNKAFQLNTLALEADGNFLFEVIYANTFCPKVGKAYGRGSSSACTMNHSDAVEIARRTRAVVIKPCDSGLCRILVPVYFRGLFLGCVGGCGAIVGTGDIPVAEITKLATRGNLSVEELLKEARESVVRLTQATTDTYIGLLEHRLKSRM